MTVLSARGAETEPEIVVAMRYLQGSGTSHSHLYLYREDGKLLRQLTKDNQGQDQDPVFAADGETIVFTRDLHGSGKQCWSIEPHGDSLHQIATPDWYTHTPTSTSYREVCIGPLIAPGAGPACIVACTFPLPDGKVEVTLTPKAPADSDAPNPWDVHLKTPDGQTAEVGELPGYSAGFLSLQRGDPAQSLLRDGALNVVFCFTHLNSTTGDTVSALDLNGRRVVQLSPNWAAPFPLPSQSAFLTLTENRYVPYSDGKHTANCSYIERWTASLKAVRYAKDKTPGICYGASMYRPGLTPATVTIRRDPE